MYHFVNIWILVQGCELDLESICDIWAALLIRANHVIFYSAPTLSICTLYLSEHSILSSFTSGLELIIIFPYVDFQMWDDNSAHTFLRLRKHITATITECHCMQTTDHFNSVLALSEADLGSILYIFSCPFHSCIVNFHAPLSSKAIQMPQRLCHVRTVSRTWRVQNRTEHVTLNTQAWHGTK